MIMKIAEILERIALPARSRKNGFKDVAKLEAMEALLSEQNSPYHLIEKNDHTWIFGQKEPAQGEAPVLISSHADIVPEITSPFSELGEDKYFHGTYDNLGTNGACVSLMINRELPDNVYFAFTAEEETGRCTGAKAALYFIREKTLHEPLCIALDVTDEGYDENRLFTLEGLHTRNESARHQILQRALSGEGENQSFEVVRLKKKDDCSFLPREYVSKNTTEFDESAFYAKQNCNSFSFCLPTDGFMHSNLGLYIKEPVLKGYELSLTQMVYIMTASYPDKIEEMRAQKDNFVKEAEAIEKRKPKTYYSKYFDDKDYDDISRAYYSYLDGRYPSTSRLYSEREDEEDEGGWTFDEYMGPTLDYIIDECYDAAEAYATNELEVYLQDMCHMYGLKKSAPCIMETLTSIFDASHEDFDYDEEQETF
jgi:hypothetical protein